MSTLLQQQNIWGFEAGNKWNVSGNHIAYKAVSWRKVCCDVLADSIDFEYGQKMIWKHKGLWWVWTYESLLYQLPVNLKNNQNL